MSRERYVNTSLAKALKILDLFDNERRELSLSDLARGLGLRPGSIYPIVYTLWRHGYLDRHPDTKRYRLGLKILVQAGYILSGLDLREQARPVLRRLVKELGGSATLSVLGNEEVIFIEEETSSPMIRTHLIGQRAPIHLTASGKVFLAFVDSLNPKALEEAPAGITEELEEIRTQGYAVEAEEFQSHAFTVAAPVRDFRGEVVAALAISVPKGKAKAKKKLAEAVLAAASEVSQALGFRPKR
jgi:DNA-binding IclR family transcriptional regulator